MKYEIRKEKRGYSVKFYITTKEEKKWFHDMVAIRVANAGRFIADIYNIYRKRDFNESVGSFTRKEA